jgi:precorrin-2 dehydrogenase/sirohydrochlorin ferrochelatase
LETPLADDRNGFGHRNQRILLAAGGFLMQGEPDVLPPAFYPVGLNLVGRRCIVIGAPGDREGDEKEHALREVGADVTRITDVAAFADADIVDAFFVISTPQDDALSARLRMLADRHKFLLCAIDQPKHGFVAMAAIVKAGPARIAISTGGVSPRVGGLLRRALQDALDDTFARFMERLAQMRRENRARFSQSEQRREAMMDAADGFALEARVTYPQWFLDEVHAQAAPERES